MIGQWSDEVQAWNYGQSMHYTFGPPVSAIAQVSLSSRGDFEHAAVPAATAEAYFMGYTGPSGDFEYFDHYVSTFGRNGMTEAMGMLGAYGCRAAAIVNFFFWPKVSILHTPGAAP